MTDKLKPCPFCGGKAKVEVNTEMGYSQYQVLCTLCPVTVGRHWYWKRIDAIKAWNTRKPMDRIVEQLAAEKLEVLASSNGGKAFEEGTLRGLNKAIRIVKGSVE